MPLPKKSTFWLVLCCLLFLTACQKEDLASTPIQFSVLDGEYNVHLPTGWEEVEKKENLFSQDSVYGAQDTNSLSYLMIRGHASQQLLDASNLQEYSENIFADYYSLEEIEPSTFSVGSYIGIHYRLQSTFNNKESWLDLYLVSVEHAIVEFQFYSPMDRQTARREAVFSQSVASLAVDKESTTETSESTPLASGEAIGTDFSLRVTTYKVSQQEGTPVIVVRYLCTNTGTEEFLPSERWYAAVTLSQNGQELSEVTKVDDTEVAYLMQVSAEPLREGQAKECAVVYQLSSNKSDVSVQFDTNLFTSEKGTRLTIEGQ